MILRVANCEGLVLFQWGRLRVEYWRVPEGVSIPPHHHSNVVSRFVFLDRNLCVHRPGSKLTRAWPWVRWYLVGEGVAHWAEADRGVARFLNFEWWTGQGASQSAAEDFHE
jgi:hypothetical protein